MKRGNGWRLGVFVVVAMAGCTVGQRGDRDVIYQTSTIGALLEGVYDGQQTVGDLSRHGDFGLGTFDGVDGEMIVEGGRFYQARSDGRVVAAGDEAGSPFAAVTFFEADKTEELAGPLTFGQLQERVAGMMPSKNVPYAVRITGRFERVRVRSVPRQARPYRKLVEVVKDQPTYDWEQVSGTVVGYWLPAYLQGVNVPGYHFHFMTADRQRGGHVLDCRAGEVRVELDECSGLKVELLGTAEFRQADLAGGKKGELEAVEK